ncbi:lysophospholipid acyltransferase family protein [bacterium]|nr:lysophospholipid acyltransferase family protein [bacterium]
MFIEFIKDLIRLFFWYPLRWLSNCIPRTLLMRIGNVLGSILYGFARERRQTMANEIRACFPGLDPGRLKRIVRAAMICFVKDQCDVLLYPRLDADKTEAITRITGLELLLELQQQKTGVILLLCHLGSNQFLMPALGFRGLHIGQVSLPADAVTVVFADQKISPVHKRMLALKRKMEESLPTRHIFLEKGLWEALNWLRAGNILAIAVDGRYGHRFKTMSFCGRPAQYSPSPFILALRTGAPLLPTFILRENNDQHHVIIEPPLAWPAESQNSRELFIEHCLSAYLKRLEHYFNAYPEQYGMFLYLAHRHTFSQENALFLQ